MSQNKLTRILDYKKHELDYALKHRSLASIRNDAEQMPSARPFYKQLESKISKKHNAVIAEIKQASPSKGLLTENFDPKKLAEEYQQGGAACLSVLTDRTFFRGDNKDLQLAKATVQLPVLRKDFIIDEYQIYQARCIEADAILLIVAGLDDSQLRDYYHLAEHLGMAILVEVHNKEELERALTLKPKLIGINNRDLTSFVTTLETSETLAPMAQQNGSLVIAESGLSTADDIKRLNNCGVYGFLIGEALVKQQHPAEHLQKLIGQGSSD